MGNAGVNPQAVPVGLHAKDVVADHIEVPGCGAGKPAVFGLAEVGRVLAGNHLAVHIRLHFVQVAFVLAVGGGDAAVQVEGAVAVAHHGFSGDNPGIVVAEDAGVLLVSRRVGGNFAQLQVILLVGGLQKHDAVLGFQIFVDGFKGLFRLAVLHADAGHHAIALAFDEDLAVVALPGADLVTEGVVGADEPFPVPAVGQHGLVHGVNLRLRLVGLGILAPAAKQRHQLRPDGHEHARNQHRLGHALVRRVGVGEGLEGLAGLVGEAVQVQAIVPVGPADERQAMGAPVVHHMVEAGLQVLQQGAAVLGIAVVGGGLVQDAEVAGLLDIGRGAGNQPQGVVVEASADVVVAFLGEGLILVVAAAVAELGGGDVQNALPCALGNLMDKAQQILAGIAEAHAAADAAFKHGSGAAHIEGDHALIGVPDVHHTAKLFIGGGQHIGAEQVIPVGLQGGKGSVDLPVFGQAAEQLPGGGLVDHAGGGPLFLLRHLHIAQDEVELLLFTGFQVHLQLMGGHGLPAGGNGVAHLASHDALRVFKAVIQPQEGFHIGVKAAQGSIHGVEGVVVAALAVLRFVVDDAALHLHLAGGEVALEVQHIVLGVPQAEFHKGGEDHVLALVGFVPQGDLVYLGVHPQGHEGKLAGAQAVLFAGDDGVAHAMAAGVLVQLGFDRLPAGVPHGAAVLDVEVAAAVVHGLVVIAVAGHAAQPCVAVEAVAARGVADDAKEILAAQIVDPGVRRSWRINDIFTGLVVKMAVFHCRFLHTSSVQGAAIFRQQYSTSRK